MVLSQSQNPVVGFISEEGEVVLLQAVHAVNEVQFKHWLGQAYTNPGVTSLDEEDKDLSLEVGGMKYPEFASAHLSFSKHFAQLAVFSKVPSHCSTGLTIGAGGYTQVSETLKLFPPN